MGRGGGGGGRFGLGGQGGCERRRIEVFVKIPKKIGGGSGGEDLGVRVDVIEKLKFWENSPKKNSGGGAGGGRFGGGGSGGVMVELNEELNFCEN